VAGQIRGRIEAGFSQKGTILLLFLVECIEQLDFLQILTEMAGKSWLHFEHFDPVAYFLPSLAVLS
jgi:hypothetical protein